MERRSFFGAIPAALVGAIALLSPRPVFAKYVRFSMRRLNRSGLPHTERGLTAGLTHQTLEDAEAFHEIAEHVRLNMLERLREEGAPVNVWRAGQVIGTVASTIDYRTGENTEWHDRHYFTVRTRVSVERPPYTHEG